jgi:putative PIN family toxin of toxin-antitoxin system
MTRAVLDSSVLISAFLTEGGTAYQVLRAARGGAFVLCLSREILAETRSSLREKVKTIRRYYAYSDERIEEHIADLAALAELTRKLPVIQAVPLDPEDDVIVATAVAAKADYLVSGDRHLLTLGAYQGIQILTPRAFLDLLEGAPRA